MSVTLTVSDKTYQRLKVTAKQKGKKNIEELLDEWPFVETSITAEELGRRKELGREIDHLQRRISERYGVMPDSTTLIREDRER